jgi:hypothetical protein
MRPENNALAAIFFKRVETMATDAIVPRRLSLFEKSVNEPRLRKKNRHVLTPPLS